MAKKVSKEQAEASIANILKYFGEDLNREGLKDTPKRYIKFFDEFFNPPMFNPTVFSAEGYDEMIIVSNIPFFSLCEHHMAPFFGVAHIGYIPNKSIIGLSKIPRILEMISRRLQNQERITKRVAEALTKVLKPKGVGVVLKAQHLCMAMRGVKKHDVWTTTSKMTGVFKDDLNCRQEFLNLIK